MFRFTQKPSSGS